MQVQQYMSFFQNDKEMLLELLMLMLLVNVRYLSANQQINAELFARVKATHATKEVV